MILWKKINNRRRTFMNNIIGIVVSCIYIVAIMLSAKLMERWGKEASRKYIHIMLCNWWFIAMYFFDNVIWAASLPFLFIIINYVSYQKGIIKVMERGKEEQEGFGTVYYAISLFILAIVSFGIIKNPIIGLVGILIMGYGDGFAAIIGKLVKSKEYTIGKHTTKTVAGSATMLVITFCILAIFLRGLPFWYLKAILASILLTGIEAVSIKGTDNLTVPLLASGLVYLLLVI